MAGRRTLLRCLLPAIVISATIVRSPAVAQDEHPEYLKNSVYLEFLGQGILYSVNYDRRISPHVSLRAGVSYWNIEPFFLLSTGNFNCTAFPVTVNYLTGDGSGHFELGAGLMPVFLSVDGREVFFGEEYHESAGTVLGTMTLGYRLQPPDGGLIFRIGFVPLFSSEEFAMTGGVSFGFVF